MTHYLDLTAYAYGERFGDDDFEPDEYDDPSCEIVNVGWLADRVPDESEGEADSRAIARLETLCQAPIRLTKGQHSCGICLAVLEHSLSQDGPAPVGAARGNGEIRVLGEGSTVYASPAMIHHYVTAHRYCPPTEFVEALIRSGDR